MMDFYAHQTINNGYLANKIRNKHMNIKYIMPIILAISSSAFAQMTHNEENTMAMKSHWQAPESALQMKNPVRANRRSINKGEVLFLNNCASCHGEKADGNSQLAKSLNPKPTNLQMMAGMHPDGDFAWKIANGRGAMPAWKGVIGQQDIWHLVNYIQSLMDPNMDHSKMPGMSGMNHSNMPGM
jgi:mono/diheme cytochrome c family protein